MVSTNGSMARAASPLARCVTAPLANARANTPAPSDVSRGQSKSRPPAVSTAPAATTTHGG